MTNPREKVLNITNYIADGFAHVCDISVSSTSAKWLYTNICNELMFSDHTSWVYALTVDNIIYKIGESGNVLGYRPNTKNQHPSASTKGRLSRYILGDGTDRYIREYLMPLISNGAIVSFWAKQCDIVLQPINILGEITQVKQTVHKDLEIVYLDRISKTGDLPILNKVRK